ncbi:MAG: roadblock/LC7 domain-containing protein, partial [Cyanobacteria bacterium SZAS LIN-3]|nr:roadblock/LC7 domain-containing protein [Cyanobacteria bacterium SZAS LIN-3]
DAWGQPAAAPAPSGDAWGNAPAAEPAPAPAASDAWGTPAAEPAPAPAAQSAWGTHPEPAQSNSAWGAQPAAEPAAAWGSQPEAAPAQPATADGWGAAASQPAWGAAPAQPAATTTGESATQNADQGGGQWGQPAAPVADTTSMASGYSTIPPGQFATPAAAGSAIASSGWGQAAVPPALDNSQIEAKKNAWAAEAEQLETGTWKAFAPKMNEGLGGKATSMPAAGPSPMGGAAAAPAGERWDVPIQERMKTQADQAAPAQAPGQPVAPVISPIQPMQPGQAAPAAARWDVPIQERPKTEGDMAAPPAVPMQPQIGMPPGAAGSPVMSSGIPVNQIVEKMGQVLGGNAEESRWDVPIQERIKSGQSSQEMPAVAAAEVQQAPVPAASSWGQPAFEAPQAPAMAAAPAPAQAADSASSWGTSSSSWGQEPAAAAPAASGWDSQPAAAPVASGWDSQPAAQTASGWNQPATSSWGDAPANNAISQQNPIVSQNQAPVGAAAWGNGADTAGSSGASSWGQPAAPAASSWASAPQQAAPPPPPPPPPPPQPPAVRPEITDKVAGGGLLSGIDDRAIDRIFGEIGVQESVSKTVVNSGGEPVSNFSPSTPAPQPMAAPEPAPFQAPPPAPAPAAFAQPEAPKGLLGGIDDNAIDRIFSQNLGVSEPSVPVGNAGMAAPASGGWTQPPVAPAPAPAPTAAETAQSSGWGAPASSGWGQPPAMTAPPAPEPAPSPNTGWGTPAASSSQWGQPPAAPAPVPAAAAAAPAIGDNGQPKLFSVDDSVMDRIFSDNLGIPSDNQPAANAQTMGAPAAPAAAPVRQTMPEMVAPAAPYTPGPPPKIEGIGRLDAGADPNQDAGSGRIASIGKFLLDQKDLDKIGKLTNTDNNEGKLRILTKENSDDLQALLGQIGTQKGVIGSVIVGHDGLLIANTMPSDMDAESVGVWALGVYMNTEHVTRKMGHERVHQVVSRTPRGYVIIADFGGGLLVTVTEGKDTDSLIPLMRTITQLVN